MNSESLKYWTTLLANLGVLLGLFFLVLEVQQNSGIAATQARMDLASMWREIDSARQDESFAELLIKSYDNPRALSVVEVTQLDAYYWGIIDQMLNAQVGAATGVSQGSFEVIADQTATIYFASEFAQAWWRHTRLSFDDSGSSDFLQAMDEAIKKAGQSEYTNPYQKIADELGAYGTVSNK